MHSFQIGRVANVCVLCNDRKLMRFHIQLFKPVTERLIYKASHRLAQGTTVMSRFAMEKWERRRHGINCSCSMETGGTEDAKMIGTWPVPTALNCHLGPVISGSVLLLMAMSGSLALP